MDWLRKSIMTFLLVYFLFGVIPQTSLDMARMVPDHAVRLRGTSHGGKSQELAPMASGHGPQREVRDTLVPRGSLGIPRPEPNHYPLIMEDRYPSVFRVICRPTPDQPRSGRYVRRGWSPISKRV